MIRRLFTSAALALSLAGAAMAAEPIKIGLVLIDSGPFASNYGMGDAAKLGVDLLNEQGGALGRKFELAVQTHPGTPAGAIAATTRVVQQDGASFFTGMFFSSMALALGPRLRGLNALMLDSNSQSDDLIGKNCQANYFRTAANDGAVINAFRSFLAKSDAKTWNIIATDFAGGHDFARKFTALVNERGGSVGQTLFNPTRHRRFWQFHLAACDQAGRWPCGDGRRNRCGDLRQATASVRLAAQVQDGALEHLHQ